MNNEQLHGEFYETKTGDLDIMTKLFKEVKKYDENALLFLNDFAVVRSSSYTRVSLIFLKLLQYLIPNTVNAILKSTEKSLTLEICVMKK